MQKYWNRVLAKRLAIIGAVGVPAVGSASGLVLFGVYGCAGASFDGAANACSDGKLYTYSVISKVLVMLTYALVAVLCIGIIMLIATKNRSTK